MSTTSKVAGSDKVCYQHWQNGGLGTSVHDRKWAIPKGHHQAVFQKSDVDLRCFQKGMSFQDACKEMPIWWRYEAVVHGTP
jgi:hypothetical protein